MARCGDRIGDDVVGVYIRSNNQSLIVNNHESSVYFIRAGDYWIIHIGGTWMLKETNSTRWDCLRRPVRNER